MRPEPPVAAVLLAAGHSRRWGPQDKLLSDWRGRPLVTWAAGLLRRCPAQHLAAVVRSDDVARAVGPGVARLAPLTDDQSGSLRAAARYAQECGAARLLIVLGDMPCVRDATLAALLAAPPDAPSAVRQADGRAGVPACLPAALLPAVLDVSGDRGARELLAGAALVTVAPDELADVDRPGDPC